MPRRYARVVVEVAPAHLDRPFDYLIPEGAQVRVGQRVGVVFAGRRRTGWIVGVGDHSAAAPDRIRPLDRIHGEHSWFADDDLALWRWVADRYAAGLADVLRHALPARVAAVEGEAREWSPVGPPAAGDSGLGSSPVQAWGAYAASRLLEAAREPRGEAFWWRPLPGDDPAAMAADLVSRCLAAGRSALVLAPDPASQLPDRALAVAGPHGTDLRAGSERERYRGFLRCRSGHARVAVGERSGVFAPLRDLGLIVVDDEANPAYKERRSPRHHAREVALARARMGGATCVLIGDLPSAQAWRLLEDGHLQRVPADRATERRRAPHIDVADLSDPRPGARRTRLADAAARALSATVRERRAAVVLAARGGQGGALGCHGCGRRLTCPVCAGSLGALPGHADAAWACASCGWQGAGFACPACGDTRTAPLAAGAGRLAAELARSHPDADVRRMEGFDAPGPCRRPAIGVMTRGSVVARPQWLADEPAAAVVLPDADAMLRRPSVEAAEDALRLWLAVARWAVPAPDVGGAGRVVVQTREPGHPAVQALVRWDPEGFWRSETELRAQLRYPPAAALVRLTAPVDRAAAVAGALRDALADSDEVLGPDPGGATLVKSAGLRGTLDALTPLRRCWDRDGWKVRVDVDPVPIG